MSEYPKELTNKRDIIECNFIFCLYKEPECIDDYKNVVNNEDIVTDDGMFYYGLAQKLWESGYRVFDNISIYAFLEDKKTLKAGFERRGGYKAVTDVTSLLNIDNIDSYYDELVKNNMLRRLYDAGFDIMKDINKLNEMNSEEIYDYYDYLLNNVCIGKIEKIKSENLSDGYDSYIDEWNSGEAVGFRIGFPILNYRLSGVHKNNLLLHLGGIGHGKTTSALLFYVLPVIKSGENVLIIANEQDVSEWRQMILASVMFNEVGCNVAGMNRKKLTNGHFTPDQIKKLKESAEWLANQKGKIEFVELQNYDVIQIKKVVKKYSKLGFGMILIDTLKPAVENSERAWADFSEVTKELFLVAKHEHVAMVATAQLSSEASYRQFLDLSCIGKSRAIAETATQVTMFRTMTKDEKENLQPWTTPKDANGRYSKVRDLHKLDPEKDYIILFTPKNRFGETSPQIVYERNMAFNTLKEIGYIDISFDGFGVRR